jgi:glycosyltransferase involved in cell wall biosynthesis
MLKIVTNCGPCEEYVARSIASIRTQSLTGWEAYVTVDPCGDRTYEQAAMACDGDPRIHIRRNRVRRFAMENLLRAVNRSAAAPEDIIVVLDGDDWFATDDALCIIDDAYRRHQCWMTYGTWVADQPDLVGMRGGRWPAYPEDTTDFRKSEWLGTAVRTWKRWLFGLIDDRDFRDSRGEYFRVTEDQAVMLPMLEMSGAGRAKHIADVLMVYNRSSPHAVGLTRCEEMLANSRYLQTLRPYARLAGAPNPGALRKMQQCCIS